MAMPDALEEAVLTSIVTAEPVLQAELQPKASSPQLGCNRHTHTGDRLDSSRLQDGFLGTLEMCLTELRRSLLNEHKRAVQRLEEANIRLRRHIVRQDHTTQFMPAGHSTHASAHGGSTRGVQYTSTGQSGPHNPSSKRPSLNNSSRRPSLTPSLTSKTENISASEMTVGSVENAFKSEEAQLPQQPLHMPSDIPVTAQAVKVEETRIAEKDESDSLSSSDSSGYSSRRSPSLQRAEERSDKLRQEGLVGSVSFDVLPTWVCGEGQTESRSGSMSSISTLRKCSQNFEEEDPIMGRWEQRVSQFVVYPSSRVYLCWDIFGLLLVIRDILVIPLQILDAMESSFTSFVTWLARLFWTADILMSFMTGYVSSQGVVEARPRQIAKHYARTRLPLDLFIVMCDWSEVVLGASAGWSLLGILRAMRLVRLIRLIKNQRSILEFMIRSEWMTLVASVQASLILLLALIHVIACVWYGIQAGSTSDMGSFDGDKAPLTGKLWERYTFCFHLVLALFLGEHLVIPQTLVERAFTVVLLFFAFVVNAAFVGTLTTAMTRLQIIASQRSAQFAALSNYLSDYGISRELALRVQRNAQHALNEQKRNTPESSVALLALISDQLRAEIHYEVYSKHLLVHPFFRFFNDLHSICIRLICHSAVSQMSLSRGDVVFSEFEVPSCPQMFFIVSGRLAYTQGMREQEGVSVNQWLAEAMLWTNWVHRGTAQALTECRFLVLDCAKFIDSVSMYRTPKRFACKYAASYIRALNRISESDISDVGCEFLTAEMVNSVCGPTENGISGRRSRITLRGTPASLGTAGFAETVNRLRQSTFVPMSERA